MPRLYLAPETLENALTGDEFELDAEISKKLVKVLRMAPGETFVAFNGFGREWECALTSVENEGKARAKAVLIKERDVENLRRVHLSVAQAVPKGDKMDFVLQKGTELGVMEFWPFDAERSVSRLDMDEDGERAAMRTARWRRIVEGACAQCGRADVPIVHSISDLATVVDYGTSGARCFMLDENEETVSLREALQKETPEWDDEVPPRVMVLVGPEGGWSAREREWALRYGAESVSLGKRILRTETAALVAATILSYEAGDL
ncbi:16S rRNA (uracil1498-N3)-methyltransferase [Abditibacterium utsteinense]|uniref:Ribosomal RNA small subunit methyltransferase E n=1 Tax=Abditibacterium utsteinense TaxID=1960156 RepID=A0A2S8SPB6_9BACT|nr:16S rRNA (uracil(1498)-N(3))-methyltransferase [Abditibacterium utsteinense]PQV62637.1 16S rRNA (uracil1498-N3)-methyltransferase [Abditibacterium utsteinense]